MQIRKRSILNPKKYKENSCWLCKSRPQEYYIYLSNERIGGYCSECFGKIIRGNETKHMFIITPKAIRRYYEERSP